MSFQSVARNEESVGTGNIVLAKITVPTSSSLAFRGASEESYISARREDAIGYAPGANLFKPSDFCGTKCHYILSFPELDLLAIDLFIPGAE
ncbi:hypothetical protein WG66_014212 [Moniliophthora roreri]|nr:hypothetical protein WG66_014212 [Moniliophthora roreri]